jgi:DNA-binding NarL/FixJ family response regulator
VPLVGKLKPDVLVTDVAMPGLYGLEVTRRVRESAPGTGVVILSRYPQEWYVTEALRRGALGYVVKQSDAAELLRAVRAVARGRPYIGAPLSDDPVDVWMERARRHTADPYDTLTSREREILQLVAEGFGNQQIAAKLCLSVKTVEAHKAHIMRKLNVKGRTELIKYAIRKGLIELEMESTVEEVAS